LLVRAKLAISAAAGAEALAIATAAAEAAKRIESNDRIGDARALAEAHRLLGDIHQRRGDAAAANRAWRAGISALSATAGDHPSIIAERAELLVRVGNRSESARLKARLEAMGIRRTDVLRA
jgi:hypothetical protein